MSDKVQEWLFSLSAEDFVQKKSLAAICSFMNKGRPEDLHRKATVLRVLLHDLLVFELKEYLDFAHHGDLDMSVITGDQNITPDLHDPARKVIADVTITKDKNTACNSKYLKYRNVLNHGYTLEIYMYDTQNGLLYKAIHTPDNFMSGIFPQSIPDARLEFLRNGWEIYDTSARRINQVMIYKGENIPDPGTDNILCDEAQQFYDNDEGFLKLLLDNASLDSALNDVEEFEESKEIYLSSKAVEIASEAVKTKTSFKFTDENELKKAFLKVESECKIQYELIHKPKPSCHGLPSLIEKVKGDVDTREAVIKSFLPLIEDCRDPAIQELITSIHIYETDQVPKQEEELKRLKVEYEEELGLKAKEALKEKYDLVRKRQKWDRNCLKLPKGGHMDARLRIGKKDDDKPREVPKVNTVAFWDSSFSDSLKLEIKRKVSILVEDEHCWTPHREYHPKTRERGSLYHRFIKTQLFQELAMVSQLSSNILRLCTKSRNNYSITTCSSLNLMALIGPSEGIMNDSVQAPLMWFSKSSEDSLLWMPAKNVHSGILMSDGDRLNKSRLEQMVDAPRIAAVACSIIACEMSGSETDLLYACGIMACVAMSINIRDSELIDHIRYMVPNIFSERSCSVDYIIEKYNTPLKTRLQALIYTETKRTLLQTASLASEYYDVEVVNDVITSGGSRIIIPFLDCSVSSVFQLNGVVYTGFFSCKKGLHDPKDENKKMFDKICEYEEKSLGKSLLEASFDKDSYHYFDHKYVGYTMYDMLSKLCNNKGWRSRMNHMENAKKPFQIKTFSSLRSSLKEPEILETISSRASKSKQRSEQFKQKIHDISSTWNEIWSDKRTRVVDQYWEKDESIFDMGKALLKEDPTLGFTATWDQKRQRTGRDREVFILDPPGKTCMYNVESLFKVVCDGIPMEKITLPGNRKIISMNVKGALYFKKMNELKKENKSFENLRMTQDMTKWAPGDNVCKFIYTIASLPFLTKQEKICYINFLCTSIRKKIVLNGVTTEAIGKLAVKKVIKDDSRWAKLLGVKKSKDGIVDVFESNKISVKYNWLMGVLNNISSAVHAASANMLERVLEVTHEIHLYQPDVHSDDASVDLIATRKDKTPVVFWGPLLDYFSRVVKVNLRNACIKLSDKKSYIDKHRKEFVSEVDDNGIMKSYWHKQAIAAISSVSYVDFHRDISEGCSKVANLISLGGPPTVVAVTMGCVVDLCRDTYSMQPGMVNDPVNILKMERESVPVELGGPITMNLRLLPIVGLKFQTFSSMMDNLLRVANVKKISEITEDMIKDLKSKNADIYSSVWHKTAEKAVQEQLVLDRLDTGLIRFKQFIAYEKTKELNVIKQLKEISKEEIEEELEKDPTLSIRSAETYEENKLKLTMMVKNPRWYSSATLQSQGALKLDRIKNARSPCCSPVLDPDQPMEKGLKTIKEAIREAYEYLQKNPITLDKTYAMLKSMPLMCYVYDLDKEAEFNVGGPRILFPVQKQPFIKAGMISSSVVGLLQRSYLGTTNYYLDYNTLEEELKLVDMYKSILEDLPRSEQVVAIYKIFQHNEGFSSVYYVPSASYKGHKSIIGIMATQESDYRKAYPKSTYQPPTNMIYDQLRHSRANSISSRCSQLACFFVRLCNDRYDAKRLFLRCKIDNQPVTDIIRESKSQRDILYAKILADMHEEIIEPDPMTPVFLIAQKRVYNGWEGDFLVYMNVGTVNERKGLLLSGSQESIDCIYLMGQPSEFPNLKQVLSKFLLKMKWKGGHKRHYTESINNSEEDGLLVSLVDFRGDFQPKFHRKGRGVRVVLLNPSSALPVLKYKDLTSAGIKATTHFQGIEIETRVLNQRIIEHFEIQSKDSLSFFPVTTLWNSFWENIKSGRKINVDEIIVLTKALYLTMDDETVQIINNEGIECFAPLELDNMNNLLSNSNATGISLNHFEPGTVWSQSDFNFYLSASLRFQSQLTSWISFKGAVLGLHRRFYFISSEDIDSRINNPLHRLSQFRNATIKMIIEYNQIGQPNFMEVEESEDDFGGPSDLADLELWKTNEKEYYRQRLEKQKEKQSWADRC